MSSPELEKLLVEHLSDMDSAAKQITMLQIKVFRELGELVERWTTKTTWSGKFDYMEDELWLAPEDWRSPGTDKDEHRFQAWFQMEVGAGDTESEKPEEDFFYLTRLCGQGTGQVGFRFRQDITTKGRWRKSFKDLAGSLSTTAFLVDAEPSFFLPVRLDSAELAGALLEQDIERALRPMDTVLEQLIAAKPAFDTIVAALKASER
jgi:hypothetical protein